MKKGSFKTGFRCFLLTAFLVGSAMQCSAFNFVANGEKLDIPPVDLEEMLAESAASQADQGRGILDEQPYIQIDDMLFPVREDSTGVHSAFFGTIWWDGNVYYVFDANVDSTNRQRFRDAAAEWSAVADLTFIEGTGYGDYIHVRSNSFNSSYVGMRGGMQFLNIYNWSWKFIIAHEIGHALGCTHEQSRIDRDSYVTILWDNIVSGAENNFSLLSTFNVGDYDFYSVMHYEKNAFSIDPYHLNTIEPKAAYSQYLNIMGQLSYLSSLDKSGMAVLYGLPNRITATPLSLDFGTWPVGGSAAGSLVIQNNGSGTVSGTMSVALPFSITSSTSYSLTDGESQTVSMQYNPITAGNHSAALSFSSGESASVEGSAIATSDTDGDGMTDWEEYIAGTDPTLEASCFKVENFECTPTGTIIQWVSVTGRTYSVLWSSALADPCEVLQSGIAHPQNSCTDTVHTAEDTGFYRLDVHME